MKFLRSFSMSLEMEFNEDIRNPAEPYLSYSYEKDIKDT